MRTCASEREEFGIVIHIVEDITHLYVVQSVKKSFKRQSRLCLEIIAGIGNVLNLLAIYSSFSTNALYDLFSNNYEYQYHEAMPLVSCIYQGSKFEDLASLPSLEQSHLVDCSCMYSRSWVSVTHQESITVCLHRRWRK